MYLRQTILVSSLVTLVVQADTSVQVTVSADIEPSACQVFLDNSGVVDFGHRALGEMHSEKTNQLGYRQINLNIQCESSRQVAWSIMDERADTRYSPLTIENIGEQAVSDRESQYGLGLSHDGKPLGGYSVSALFSASQVDGQLSRWGYRHSGLADGAWERLNGDTITQPGIQTYTPTQIEAPLPLAFTSAQIPLRVAAALAPTNALHLRDETPISGESTITLIYL